MMNERAYWVAWSQVYGVGPVLLRRLHQHFGCLAIAWQAEASELLGIEGVGLTLADAIHRERQRLDPDELLEQHERDNLNFWTLADENYPRLLREIPDPPAILYYQGQVNVDELSGVRPTIAIVGTRAPSEYGKRWTRRITEMLSQQGFTIVSGLAEGVDTETHRSCLVVGGRTIAVLGCGVDVVYPWSNRGLHQQILQTGLVLSEHPAGTKPDRTFFPRRNRIIAGLSRATLVMEAPEKSGGLITAHYANEYGRDVYALPGSLDNPRAIGCLKLISKGAHPILEDELVESLGLIPSLTTAPVRESSPPVNLAPELEQLLNQISRLCQEDNTRSVAFDRLVQMVELPASSVSGLLLQLELEGCVTQLPGMRYQPS